MALIEINSKPKQSKLGVIAKVKIQEEFKGEIIDKNITFPKDLGAEHPFNFKDTEELYKQFGFVTGIVDKYVDNAVGDFNVKCDNENSQAIIDEFVDRTNFKVILKEWVREGLTKGNGFMELDLLNTQTRVLNANNMYVKRDNKGTVKQYNQYSGLMKTYSRNSKKLVTFEPNQIAHLPINNISDEPYAIGIVYPNMKELDRLISNLVNMGKLVERKAGAPYHVKVGQPGEAVAQKDVDDMQEKLTFLNTRTEWTTDGNVDIKLLDFGDIGKNFDTPINKSLELLYAGFQVPPALMGIANIPEGMANVQMEAFQRRCRSIQEVMEKVIEEKIFRPLLLAQNNPKLDAKIDIEWELPGEDEKNIRIEKITGLLGMGVNISENFNRMLQIELANAMGIENAETFLRKPEVGLDDKKEEEAKQEQEDMDKEKSGEEKEEEKIEQPEVPGAKPGTKQSNEDLIKEVQDLKDVNEMTLTEFIDIPVTEIQGFNYSDYMAKAIKLTKKDKFVNLAALNEMDIDLGLLSVEQVSKLKIILKDGFKKNKNMLAIETDIKDSLGLKDRYNLKDGNKIFVKSAESRPNSIARTEVVRLSNLALNETYKERGVDKVRWLAAVSDRTCDICMGLNGQVFGINEGERPPAHTNCRCSTIPVILE